MVSLYWTYVLLPCWPYKSSNRLNFSVEKSVSSLNRNGFTSSFWIWISLFLLSFLTVMAKWPELPGHRWREQMRIAERGCVYHAFALKGRYDAPFTIKYDMSCVLHRYLSSTWESSLLFLVVFWPHQGHVKFPSARDQTHTTAEIWVTTVTMLGPNLLATSELLFLVSWGGCCIFSNAFPSFRKMIHYSSSKRYITFVVFQLLNQPGISGTSPS